MLTDPKVANAHMTSKKYLRRLLLLFKKAIADATLAILDITEKRQQEQGLHAELDDRERMKIYNDYLSEEVTFDEFMEALCPV